MFDRIGPPNDVVRGSRAVHCGPDRHPSERGLSLAEKDLLQEGVAPLVAEVAIAVRSDEEDALAVLEAMVAERGDDVLQRRGLVAA